MKKIHIPSLKKLRVGEDFGFQKILKRETEKLPPKEQEPVLGNALEAFGMAYARFDAALNVEGKLDSVAEAAAADKDRGVSWRRANQFFKVMAFCPDAEVASLAAKARRLFNKYGNPSKKSQSEKSGILHNLLQELYALDADKRAAFGFTVWIDDLREKEEAFLAAAGRRTGDEAGRRTGAVRASRTAADAACRSLLETVNALAAVRGEEEYADFIDSVNVVVERQWSVLRARTTRRAKDEQAEE